eukprot:scaffold3166_cov399-Prasinococcus_capsulatus_cf.AAC.26
MGEENRNAARPADGPQEEAYQQQDEREPKRARIEGEAEDSKGALPDKAESGSLQVPPATPLDSIPAADEAVEDAENNGVRPRPDKKRKVALFIMYMGEGYQGMQRNPGAKTIEAELEQALNKAGGISDQNFGEPSKVQWARAARTDKGVSALCQVVSLNMVCYHADIVDRINSNLPEQIRVMGTARLEKPVREPHMPDRTLAIAGYRRVVKSFNAKNMCDRRKYEYVLPLFMLDPTSHRSRADSAKLEQQQGGKGEQEASVDVSVKTEPSGEKPAEAAQDGGRAPDSTGDGKVTEPFTYTKSTRAALNRLLKKYEGTHNFHNFTTRVKCVMPLPLVCMPARVELYDHLTEGCGPPLAEPQIRVPIDICYALEPDMLSL